MTIRYVFTFEDGDQDGGAVEVPDGLTFPQAVAEAARRLEEYYPETYQPSCSVTMTKGKEWL